MKGTSLRFFFFYGDTMDNGYQVGLDTMIMYRGVLSPDTRTYKDLNKAEEWMEARTQGVLNRYWNEFDSFVQDKNPAYVTSDRIGKAGVINEFLKDCGLNRIRVNYDIDGLIVSKLNNRIPIMIFYLKVRHEENNNVTIISPQIHMGQNPKILINTSLHTWYHKDKGNLDKEIDWPLALNDLRDYLNMFWDDLREDFGCDMTFFRDNQRWTVSRFDLECDINTGNAANTYYMLYKMSKAHIPGYRQLSYESGQSVKYIPAGNKRKRKGSIESSWFKSTYPGMNIYNKKLELRTLHSCDIEPTVRAEKMFYKNTFRNERYKGMRWYLTKILNHELYGDRYEHVMYNDDFIDLAKQTYGYNDLVLPYLTKYLKKAKELKRTIKRYDQLTIDLLVMIAENNGNASQVYLMEKMKLTKWNLQRKLKYLQSLGLVCKPLRKWGITLRGKEVLGGDYE